MALKLLNPGLRPLGMFDLDDESSGNLVGGEYVELQAMDTDDVEGYAADVGQLTGGSASRGANFARGSRSAVTLGTAVNLGGLADEGGEQYGTLFGDLIGMNAGQATSIPAGTGGAVVIGPSTDRASGKVTVWATAGLYGVTDGTGTELDAAAANEVLFANGTTGLLQTTGAGAQCAIYVGEMSDTSLVSTTNTAAGVAADAEYHAVFYLGNGAV